MIGVRAKYGPDRVSETCVLVNLHNNECKRFKRKNGFFNLSSSWRLAVHIHDAHIDQFDMSESGASSSINLSLR